MTRILILLAFSACATGKVRPEDESAEAHRKEAAGERAAAQEERQKYDPNQERTSSAGARSGFDVGSYNPTAWHLHRADTLSAHARAHEAAAAQLESFEAEECRAFAPKVRAACPVAGPIVKSEEIPGGVRYLLAEDAPIEAVVAHMRCHFAWARARGFDNLPGCPIYIRGITIREVGRAIEVTAREAATVSELRRRAREEG